MLVLVMVLVLLLLMSNTKSTTFIIIILTIPNIVEHATRPRSIPPILPPPIHPIAPAEAPSPPPLLPKFIKPQFPPPIHAPKPRQRRLPPATLHGSLLVLPLRRQRVGRQQSLGNQILRRQTPRLDKYIPSPSSPQTPFTLPVLSRVKPSRTALPSLHNALYSPPFSLRSDQPNSNYSPQNLQSLSHTTNQDSSKRIEELGLRVLVKWLLISSCNYRGRRLENRFFTIQTFAEHEAMIEPNKLNCHFSLC
ncbi:hypothetical protein V8G54_026031 [Vigna mungo]|uniref:Uncharacterized protein n=1 Tax=Vigna mungo TaxID=3915 RepID=A0AAQ3MZU4_VIGMU